MQVSVSQIAKLINGEVEGDGSALLSTVAKIEEGTPGALSFLANPKYEAHIYTTGSTAVLVNKDFKASSPISATLIRVENAYTAFTQLLEHFSNQVSNKTGVDSTAIVHSSVSLGNNVWVGDMSFIEEGTSIGENSKIAQQVFIGRDVKLGKNCVINPGVKIYHGSQIGDNVIIHSGTVIGSDGFGFAPQPDKSYKKIPQTGIVVIENDVEIGSNTTIDRATMGSTVIHQGAKIDNLVQIAHNVEIGEHTVIAAQTGIAGSTKIGKYCIIAGQVGFTGHITVADGSTFAAQSGITGNITKPNEKWMGFPATEYGKIIRAYALFKNLPDIEKRLSALEKLNKNKENE